MGANMIEPNSKSKLIVVDDEPAICQMMEDFFLDIGYDVTCYTDPIVALDQLREVDVDLVISDLKLSPEIDGTQVLRQMHEYHPDAVGILMTAHPSLEVAVQVLKEGAYDYLQKPVNLMDLKSTVERGLEKSRLSKEVQRFSSALSMIRYGQATPDDFYLPTMLKQLVDAAVNETGTHGGAILLYEKSDGVSRVKPGAVTGIDCIENPWPTSLKKAYEAVCESMIEASAVEGALRPLPSPSIPGIEGQEVVAYPIAPEGKLRGLLCLGYETGRRGERRSGAALRLFLDIVGRTIEYGRVHQQLRADYINVIRALGNAVEAKDPYTRGHSDHVVHFCEAVGKRLGFKRQTLEKLGVAGILHDIGKIGISDSILLKPGKLDASEWEDMKKHPGIGDKILAPIRSLDDVRTWIYQHHERMDGKGYPQGLVGSQITKEGKLLIVCEVFDALITERAYKPAWPIDKTIDYLWSQVDTHFDRNCVEAFIAEMSSGSEDFLKFDPEKLITHTTGMLDSSD
jgi:response regulator RpfG family c-di-GMP phosphodiesterase